MLTIKIKDYDISTDTFVCDVTYPFPADLPSEAAIPAVLIPLEADVDDPVAMIGRSYEVQLHALA
jgi:hypothetical protein